MNIPLNAFLYYCHLLRLNRITEETNVVLRLTLKGAQTFSCKLECSKSLKSNKIHAATVILYAPLLPTIFKMTFRSRFN